MNDLTVEAAVYTASEIVGLLKQKSVRTVNDLAAKGKLPGAFKVGRSWRFVKAAVDAYLARAATVPPPVPSIPRGPGRPRQPLDLRAAFRER